MRNDSGKMAQMQGRTEEKIKEYDALALEDHSYEATPQDLVRWQRNWEIGSDREGVHGPIRQRPDFREAKRASCPLYKEHVESTGRGNQSIHPAQQRRQNPQQQSEGHEEHAYKVHLDLDGGIILNMFVFILAVAAEQ